MYPMTDKIQLGKPLELSDEEIDLLSEITPEDIESAKRLWRKAVSPDLRDLLDAEEEA